MPEKGSCEAPHKTPPTPYLQALVGPTPGMAYALHSAPHLEILEGFFGTDLHRFLAVPL